MKYYFFFSCVAYSLDQYLLERNRFWPNQTKILIKLRKIISKEVRIKGTHTQYMQENIINNSEFNN